jgi:hypothetical protein
VKTIRNSFFCFALMALAVPTLFAQSLSRYRAFSFGTSVTSVLQLTDQKDAEVKIIHQRPALMQELTWWPLNTSNKSQSRSVEHINFSFYEGQLYRLSVSYDSRAVQGLTAQDMVQTITTMYGVSADPAFESDRGTSDRFDSKPRIIATWVDWFYSSSLFQTTPGEFVLIAFCKSLNAKAETSDAEAMALDEQERPQKKAAELKKQDADLEIVRQKNMKSFQP